MGGKLHSFLNEFPDLSNNLFCFEVPEANGARRTNGITRSAPFTEDFIDGHGRLVGVEV